MVVVQDLVHVVTVPLHDLVLIVKVPVHDLVLVVVVFTVKLCQVILPTRGLKGDQAPDKVR